MAVGIVIPRQLEVKWNPKSQYKFTHCCLGPQTLCLWGLRGPVGQYKKGTQIPQMGCVDLPPKPILQSHITSWNSPSAITLHQLMSPPVTAADWRESSSHKSVLSVHRDVAKACGLCERMTQKHRHLGKKRGHLLLLPLFSFLFLFLFFFAFYGCTLSTWKFPSQGSNRSYSCQIQAASTTYTTAHGNARSLTHWAGLRMGSASSWILVGFISAEPLEDTSSLFLKMCLFGGRRRGCRGWRGELSSDGKS